MHRYCAGFLAEHSEPHEGAVDGGCPLHTVLHGVQGEGQLAFLLRAPCQSQGHGEGCLLSTSYIKEAKSGFRICKGNAQSEIITFDPGFMLVFLIVHLDFRLSIAI